MSQRCFLSLGPWLGIIVVLFLPRSLALGRTPIMHSLPVFSLLLSSFGLAAAQSYSVYRPNNQVVFGGTALSSPTPSASAAAASYTGAAAYDPTVLQAPAPPTPPINTNQFVQLYSGGMNGLSRQLNGAFFGFSVEMSVATHVCP